MNDSGTERQAELEAINYLQAVALRSAAGASFGDCVHEILEAAIALSGADKGNVQLLDESGALRIAAHRGFSEPFLNHFACVRPDSAAACGAAARASTRMIVEDVTRSEIFTGQASLGVLIDAGVRAVQSTPLRTTSGQVVGMISTHFSRPHRPDERVLRLLDVLARLAADMIERRRVEDSARHTQATLAKLVERCPFGMYIVDADFRIAHMNTASQEGAFINVRPVIGRPFEEAMHVLWPEEVAAQIIARFREALVTGEPFLSTDFLHCRADTGTVEGYEWELHRITMPDGRFGVICYYFNSTRLRELESKLRQHSDELDASNRRKTEFIAVLSHELRTPLNAIAGWAELLKRPGLGDDDRREGVEIISKNARMQAQLISDLLDVQRISTGKLSLRLGAVNLGSEIEAAVGSARLESEGKTVRIDTGCGLDPLVISGDAARVQQVLDNLLSNAIKFTPAGGTIRVGLCRVDSHAEISVSDTGQGIDPGALPYIFDRFRQSDSAERHGTGGLGLGLAIAKQLVELHGGTISAQSAGEGYGATFTVSLPLVAGTCSTEPAVSTLRRVPSLALSGTKVLVVDDQAEAREPIRRILQDHGAEVASVRSAREAIEAIHHQRPDVVVSDIRMPHQDGYELVRAVRALSPDRGGTTPVIALTAFGTIADRERALEAGFAEHFVKPIDPSDLLTAVASLGKRRLKA